MALVTVTQVRYPIAPAVAPRFGTLLDSADVQSGVEWLVDPTDGVAKDLFESYASMQFVATAEFCTPGTKDFDQSGIWADGFSLVAYGGVMCKSVGGGVDLDKVRQAFDQGESTAVEAGLMDVRFSPSATWDPPTDITPAGGAVKPKVGQALLEGWIARRYVGAPLIHAPVVIASLLMEDGTVERDGDTLVTPLGSRLVAGAGYDEPNVSPAGAAAAAGEKWLYVSGGVLVRQGEVNVIDALDRSNNEVMVLAERAYVVAVDGPVAGIRVQVAA